MLKSDLKDTIQQSYRECVQKMGLTTRLGQRQMVAQVANTLGAIHTNDDEHRDNDAGIAAIEAGTGTGKTLAYLLGALPVALATGKTLVISTATVALQEQILDKDLPNLQNAISLPFKFALAKGRGRYLCLSKLDKALQHLSGFAAMTVDLFEKTPEEKDKELYETMLSEYANGNWDGDRDRWPDDIGDEQWQHLSATHQECSSRLCANFKHCAFFKARLALDDADIIVANHDLVLSDLTLGGGVVLPPPEDTIYVFDEGHHLAEKALGHFHLEVGVRAQRQWLMQLEKGLEQFVKAGGIPSSLIHGMTNAPEHINALLEDINLLWPLLCELMSNEDKLRFEFGVVPDALRELLLNMKHPLQSLLVYLDSLVEVLQTSLDPKEDNEVNREVAESWLAPMSLMLKRADQLSQTLSWLSAQEAEGDIPIARWLVKVPYGDDVDIRMSACPISVSEQLRKNLWWRCYGAVITSATLTALNSFNNLSFSVGLPKWTHYQCVPSPFDYAKLGQLNAVNLASDPNSAHFQQDVEDWLTRNIDTRQGNLVLFSSRAQLEATRDALLTDWRDYLLCQGFLPKAEIVKRHRARIDTNEGSIIFGLASFAEGIDLPGKYVTHVVVVKIPFAVPDDPIQAATSEWMESRGRNPFMELTLPAASVRLVQACGRLIRTESDEGKVSILDNRLLKKRYGQQLLNALPPFARVSQ